MICDAKNCARELFAQAESMQMLYNDFTKYKLYINVCCLLSSRYQEKCRSAAAAAEILWTRSWGSI